MERYDGQLQAVLRTFVAVFITAVFGGLVELGWADEWDRQRISLAGQWAFALDREDVGQEQHWYAKRLKGYVRLPGSLAENGVGDDISVDTPWTGTIVDRSWFTEERFARYRKAGQVKVPFWLTPVKYYVGPAWYQRKVVIPQSWAGKRVVLFLERCHWQSRVWVDGRFAGQRDSLSVPHVYDLTGLLRPGEHLLSIRVDNSLLYEVGVNAHSVSDHTQTNWNGIIGRIELVAVDKVWIEDVQLYPRITEKAVEVQLVVGNATGERVDATVTVSARKMDGEGGIGKAVRRSFELEAAEQQIVLKYELGPEAVLWDEFSPVLYELEVTLESRYEREICRDRRKVQFGLREFGRRGTHFAINGRVTFLRGTLECCVFPLTGYPAMDVESWLRIFRTARSYGLNHMRFHSWCPPEAAFKAADRMGFLLHVEGPVWTKLGEDERIDKFVYAESDRILQAYGNHPSFCMLAVGNEPAGQGQHAFLSGIVSYWKKKDRRRLYTGCSGWPVTPESDYHSRPQPRGHAWGAGLRSRFNATRPSTNVDYRKHVGQFTVPVVTHEMGQWCAYPNFREIDKYRGVLRAYNFEIFRDSLAEHGMLDQAEDFLMASGKLQALLYKEEIETALRTEGFGGFQLLDIHDFPGQGTALVGVLDAFWDSKGYIEAERFRRFCCETVPLLRMPKRVWKANKRFEGTVQVAHFGPTVLQGAAVVWSVRYADGRLLRRGQFKPVTITIGNGNWPGKISFSLAGVAAPAKLVVRVGIEGTRYENEWDIWVYPAELDVEVPEAVTVADRLDEEVVKRLRRGGRVLLLARPETIDSDVPAGFTTIFWNTAWTRRQPPHTLGLLCDPNHPALRHFPTEFHSNWQWWEIVRRSRAMVLDGFGDELRPIVQVIDDWNTNRKLGLLFEARVGEGKLLVCSMDLRNELESRPVARQMLYSLLRYVGSEAFGPQVDVEVRELARLFRAPPLVSRAARISCDSEAEGYEARNAIDGDRGSIWHTPWGPGAPDYPHELCVELKEPAMIRGIRYLPRQDMSNGWIQDYELYVSLDGKQWGKPVATGRFAADRRAKKVVFEKEYRAKYIRFVAIRGFGSQKFASVAELDVIWAED